MTARPEPNVDALAERAARGLRAGREFINGLPLNDGSSQRAKDREFIALALIPDGLMALDQLAALARANTARDHDQKGQHMSDTENETTTERLDAADALLTNLEDFGDAFESTVAAARSAINAARSIAIDMATETEPSE